MKAHYPGENAQPDEILRLAHEYRAAAEHLFGKRRKRQPMSLAPCRLTAIHAIELYLNAHLVASGMSMKDVRALGHDLTARAERSRARGLVFRALTAKHLVELTGSREYLEARYDPAMTKTQLSRLLATLGEVAAKVTKDRAAAQTKSQAKAAPAKRQMA